MCGAAPKPRIRALTQADVDAFNNERRALMGALAQRWQRSGGTDLHALLGALHLCAAAMPRWLVFTLRDLVTAQLPPISVDRERHHWVLACHDEAGLTWDESYERTSDLLKGTPAAAGPDAMKRSYQLVEKSLPSELKRQRTYRPKPLG